MLFIRRILPSIQPNHLFLEILPIARDMILNSYDVKNILLRQFEGWVSH
jgi:hypothetical protein